VLVVVAPGDQAGLGRWVNYAAGQTWPPEHREVEARVPHLNHRFLEQADEQR